MRVLLAILVRVPMKPVLMKPCVSDHYIEQQVVGSADYRSLS
ncbi:MULTISPECIES: hypothetical protein [unclassified Vibrio]|uniref:Uncharacterized protein n=1 Tax=Vibrio sp. HB236076 TaxID=3232307 RepID=A0AB39HLK8_9VIBR|nr:hypothetical protein [Vibrio sp. HB161653]MDP5253042.1 hypothetical protein [Vibrio sp. HB161653]